MEPAAFPKNLATSTCIMSGWIMRYLLYRAGLRKQPYLRHLFPESLTVLRILFGAHRNLRLVGAENCPESGPAIFTSNHALWTDPFFTLYPIWIGSSCHIRTYSMMRDDFFAAARNPIVDFDEVLQLVGAYPISRGQVQFSQLKPFVRVLKDGDCFFMYPGGTRSRSGLFIEYRDGHTGPGGVAFFLAKAQREAADGPPPVAVPMARTRNPATRQNAVVFGEPMPLGSDIGKEAQRAFDHALIERMGNLVEFNMAHGVAGVVYLRCLHGRPGPIGKGALLETLTRLVEDVQHPYVDPAVRDRPEKELEVVLRFLAKRGMLRLEGHKVHPEADAVLACPPLDSSYKKQNPVKYVVNQVLHLPAVVASLETAALAIPE